MKGPLLIVGLLLLTFVQVTAAPYFLMSGAQIDLLLVTLAILMVFQGRKAAMVSLPVVAILLGFASDRSPATIILALLPLLPLAYWLEESASLAARYVQTLLAVGLTSVWARTLLAMTAFAHGAQLDAGTLMVQVVLPGLILDLTLLSLAYVACRLLGLEPRSLSPVRERYRA